MFRNIVSLFLLEILCLFLGCSSLAREDSAEKGGQKNSSRAYSEYNCVGFKLKQDGELFFYRVQPGDTLGLIVDNIRKKCGQRFGYLQYDEYAGIKGFNIPKKSVRPNFLLAVPIDRSKTKITAKTLGKAVETAVSDIKLNRFYKKRMKNLLRRVSVTDLKKTVYAFAMSESELGEYSLVRWEERYGAYSFSYFHILMERSNGKVGPGLKARIKLDLTEGDVVADPVSAVKLFIGYWFEKTRMDDCFELSDNNYRACGKIYNGSSAYAGKLRRFHLASNF